MTMSLKKSRGTHKTGDNTCTSAVDVETITSATRRLLLIRRWKEWSGRQDDSLKKYR
jgi:hypothetical protein